MNLTLQIALVCLIPSILIIATGYESWAEIGNLARSTSTSSQMLEASNAVLICVAGFVVAASCLGVFMGLALSRRIGNLKSEVDRIAGQGRNDGANCRGDEIDALALSLGSVMNSLAKYTELYSQSEKKYKEFYENSLALYRTINKEGIIIDCNTSYAERLGYKKEEVIGRSIFEHCANIEAMKESFETWKSTGKVRNREVWFKCKNGATFPSLISATNLYDKNDNIVGSNTVIKDISEIYETRKREEREELMLLQLEEFIKNNKLKVEFASMITHELKTPLFPIMGRCEMLKEPGLLGALNDLQLDSVNKIQQNVRLFERLVRNVLDAQKLEIRKMRFDKEGFDVAEFMADIHKDYLPLMDGKEIKFVNLTGEKLALTSDRNRIRQVIDNLVHIAADFVPQKSGRIEISARGDNGKVVFSIKDNGTGIPLELQSIMSKKLFQVDSSLTRQNTSISIGLVVCKGIVEGLGGKIWFESQPGAGTHFHFAIPMEPI